MIHVVFGPTGLIGNELIHLIPPTDSLITIGRKPISQLNPHHRHLLSSLETSSLESLNLECQPDAVYICLGTTLKAAGSKDEFYRIDHDLVVNAAIFANRLKAKKLLVISAVGTNSESKLFYSRVKGEMERDVEKMTPAVSQVVFIRPSLLMGDRASLNQPLRITERMSILLAPIYSRFMVGYLLKYRPIESKQVAAQLLHLARSPRQGERVSVIPNEALFS